ncbi:SDR family NAD(P)-dependent oxidoreductase [Pantoea stewartii]|uniref:SDR family NAD(P)-dependent oxidoreductase n=1 Tax=Pantoea stewartii TaxID=66269 RepID=UPI003863C38D
MQLRMKRCVISGAASGIGAAIAMLFAREGAHLILTDRDSTKLKTVVDQCRQSGVPCFGIVADVGEVEGATAGAVRRNRYSGE